eukprot:112406-Prymnesium_polylepis.1
MQGRMHSADEGGWLRHRPPPTVFGRASFLLRFKSTVRASTQIIPNVGSSTLPSLRRGQWRPQPRSSK